MASKRRRRQVIHRSRRKLKRRGILPLLPLLIPIALGAAKALAAGAVAAGGGLAVEAIHRKVKGH